jgi:hypothetical protein
MLLVRRKLVQEPVVAVSPLRRVARIVHATPTVAATQVVRAVPRSANSAITREIQARLAKEEINQQLKLIANAEAAIDDAQEAIELAYLVIERKLRDSNLISHSNGVYLAEIVEQFTRQSRTVNPKKFRTQVTADVFWDSVSVDVGKALKHLSDKELTKIADVVPGKSTGHVLKVKKLEPKRRSKG